MGEPRMQTISFIAPKGGSGRTTAAMATATAFIEAGSRVGLLDLTNQAQWPSGQSSLSQWADSMVASGISANALMMTGAWDRASMTDAFLWFEAAGCAVVVVDTGPKISDLTEEVIWRSDLILMPFVSYVEAVHISGSGFTGKYPEAKIYGLATGLEGTPEKQAIHRRAFFGAPLLTAELAHNEVFRWMVQNGSCFKLKAGTGGHRHSAGEVSQARANLITLVGELGRVLTGPHTTKYVTNRPLGDGSPLGHLQALRDAAPDAFRH